MPRAVFFVLLLLMAPTSFFGKMSRVFGPNSQRPREYLPHTQKGRWVLLIVPSEEILRSHNTERPTLVVDLGVGKRLTIPEYSWFAFWVGCAADVNAYVRREKVSLVCLT